MGWLEEQFSSLQQWLFEALVQPSLFAFGLGHLLEDGYAATGWLLVGLLGFVGSACGLSSEDEDSSGVVTLAGQVLNQDTNNPVPRAYVQVMPLGLRFEADSVGRYAFDVEMSIALYRER